MYVRSNILHSPHAFSTRVGGISKNAHTASLNLAFGRGDSDSEVLENLRLFAREAGFRAEDTVSLPQIHSSDILTVTAAHRGMGYFKRDSLPELDGYVTCECGMVIGIKTADCVPILLEGDGEDGKVAAVGAVHAGWRGTVGGIAPKCVDKLCKEFNIKPQSIRAAIGPSIRQCCYEVGYDVYSAVSDKLGSDIARCFLSDVGGRKYMCDLSGINKELLLRAGLYEKNIDILDTCTCCHSELFFSHRYSNGQRGTMLNVIYIDQ